MLSKKSNLEAGYVFAPYIMMTTNAEIRKIKISKIFNLNSKSIKSRYATKIVNSNSYGIAGSSGSTGPIGVTGFSGLYYKQLKRKVKIENIFNKKPSI